MRRAAYLAAIALSLSLALNLANSSPMTIKLKAASLRAKGLASAIQDRAPLLVMPIGYTER
jgi:hypothetical protein